MLGLRSRYYRAAMSDLRKGFFSYRIWMALAYDDLINQYRRTTLGPFWITLSTLIMVLTFGILYGKLMNRPISEQLPYVACGLIFWNYFQSMAINGCNVFSLNSQMIRQIPLPISVYVYKLAATNLITLAHNAVIIIVVIILFVKPPVSATTLLFVPGFIIFFITSISISTILGVFSTRFRDLPEIVQGILRPLMFVTPIIWNADLMPGRAKFVNFNIFHHLVDLVRRPLLGGTPSTLSWLVAIVTMIIVIGLAFYMYIRYRHRIAYWV